MASNQQRNVYDNFLNMYAPGHEPGRNVPYPVDDLPQNGGSGVSNNPFIDSNVPMRRQPVPAGATSQGGQIQQQQSFQQQQPEHQHQHEQHHHHQPAPPPSQQQPQQQPTERSAPPSRDLSEYSPEAIEFYRVYQQTINDANKFTKPVQLKWCETLLQYAFKPSFLIRYNINAERLKRDLKESEMSQNKRTILEHALRVLTKLTQLNYPPALYLLGTLYSHQPYIAIPKPMEIVNKNDAKALDYYRRAADLGHKEAMYRTGVCYEYGRGVDRSILGEHESLKLAQKYYETGALSKGDSSSMYKLGMFYLKGLATKSGEIVIEKDPMQALYWFRMAVKEIEIPNNPTGNSPTTLDSISPQAMMELGKIYGFEEIDDSTRQALLRNGISQNKVTAIKYYYRCAHEFDYSLAQYKLGRFYEFGEMGLPVIPKKSIAWYAKSSMNKTKPNPMAMVALSGWYLTGAEGVLKPNDKEAFKWVSRASALSDGKLSRAEYALAFYLEKGLGCYPNPQEAHKHYQIAARLGHPKAIEALGLAPRQ